VAPAHRGGPSLRGVCHTLQRLSRLISLASSPPGVPGTPSASSGPPGLWKVWWCHPASQRPFAVPLEALSLRGRACSRSAVPRATPSWGAPRRAPVGRGYGPTAREGAPSQARRAGPATSLPPPGGQLGHRGASLGHGGVSLGDTRRRGMPPQRQRGAVRCGDAFRPLCTIPTMAGHRGTSGDPARQIVSPGRPGTVAGIAFAFLAGRQWGSHGDPAPPRPGPGRCGRGEPSQPASPCRRTACRRRQKGSTHAVQR